MPDNGSFKPLEAEHRDWVNACRDAEAHPFTALSFPSLFTWRNAYGFTIAGDPDYFVIHSAHDNAYYCPCGDPDKCMAFVQERLRKEKDPRFLYLTREQAMEAQHGGARICLRDDLSEYIAFSGSLNMTEGYHITNSFKMKVRHFQRGETYTVRPLTEADIPLLRELAAKTANEEDRGDQNVLLEEIAWFGWLGLRGVLLETTEGKQAFILGYENMEGEFTMTMTRHDPSLPPQITAVMVHALAGQIAEEYRLVNLEEDLGMKGLRQAKLLYSPMDRRNVYEAIR